MKKVQDHYFHKAKQENYAARSVYKLQEINQKYHLLHPGDYVLDLGCSPGSWLQYIAKIIGKKGQAIGIDLNPISSSFSSNVRFIQGDANNLSSYLEDPIKFNIILSDMAPKTTGIKSADAERSYQLCLTVLNIAQKYLQPQGSIVMKIFQGAAQQKLNAIMKEQYQQIKTFKPQSSRKESVEIFMIGRNILDK